MGNGMNKILPGLFVGNFRDSKDEKQLKENKITHILSIHDNAKPYRSDMIYLCLDARDVGTQDLSQYFSQCNDFIHSARIYGGSVLIHCLAGMSRSVTVTVAYIMTVTSLGWRDSLNVVRASRTCASPNFGFQRQLLAFQHDTLSQEKIRLLAAYPSGTYDLTDAQDCQGHLDQYECQQIMERHEAEKDPESSSPRPTPRPTSNTDYSGLFEDLFPMPGANRSSLVVKLIDGYDARRKERAERAAATSQQSKETDDDATHAEKKVCRDPEYPNQDDNADLSLGNVPEVVGGSGKHRDPDDGI